MKLRSKAKVKKKQRGEKLKQLDRKKNYTNEMRKMMKKLIGGKMKINSVGN